MVSQLDRQVKMYYANQGGHEGGQAPHPIFETPKTSVSLTNALSKIASVVFDSAQGDLRA